MDQQGDDFGTRMSSYVLSDEAADVDLEYRTVIFYHSPEQLEIAKRVTEEVQKQHFDPNGRSHYVCLECK